MFVPGPASFRGLLGCEDVHPIAHTQTLLLLFLYGFCWVDATYSVCAVVSSPFLLFFFLCTITYNSLFSFLSSPPSSTLALPLPHSSLRFLYPMYMLPHCLFFILFALSISPEEQRKAVGVLAIVFYFSFFISPSSGLCSNSVSALSIVSTRVWESASVKARGGLIFNTFSHLPST